MLKVTGSINCNDRKTRPDGEERTDLYPCPWAHDSCSGIRSRPKSLSAQSASSPRRPSRTGAFQCCIHLSAKTDSFTFVRPIPQWFRMKTGTKIQVRSVSTDTIHQAIELECSTPFLPFRSTTPRGGTGAAPSSTSKSSACVCFVSIVSPLCRWVSPSTYDRGAMGCISTYHSACYYMTSYLLCECSYRPAIENSTPPCFRCFH